MKYINDLTTVNSEVHVGQTHQTESASVKLDRRLQTANLDLNFDKYFYSNDLSTKIAKNGFTKRFVAFLNLFSDTFRLDALARNLFEICFVQEDQNAEFSPIVWAPGSASIELPVQFQLVPSYSTGNANENLKGIVKQLCSKDLAFDNCETERLVQAAQSTGLIIAPRQPSIALLDAPILTCVPRSYSTSSEFSGGVVIGHADLSKHKSSSAIRAKREEKNDRAAEIAIREQYRRQTKVQVN